jgi:hypothetical protein
MIKVLLFKYLLTALLLCYSLLSIAQTFRSGNAKTQLLELYSSQGCSSCPPAEKWVSNMIDNPQLWNTFIPLVFHVDYWNYLGWKDPFSNQKFSQRQRRYHAQGNINSVYTPGFILNGEEWRGRKVNELLLARNKSSGILSAKLTNNVLQVRYEYTQALQLNIALLGFGIKTEVLNGENSGSLFSEDFIVLDFKSIFSDNAQWNLPVTTDSEFNASRYALVLWVNNIEDLQPLQAVGGWIDP